MADIVITEFMDASAVEELNRQYRVHWDEGLVERRSELLACVGDARAIIVRNRTQVDRELLRAAPRLQVVGRLGVGLDNIDLEACEERGIKVCPAYGANAPSVAEYVIGAALVLVRGVFRDGADVLAGAWPRTRLSAGGELGGRTMGLIGFGTIGQEVAARAAALGMRILACDNQLAASDPSWSKAESVSLQELVVASDVISLHVPLTDATRGMVTDQVLADMRPGAVIINTSRGGIIDETALAAALLEGNLHGAALDVFDHEPVGAETLAKFRGIKNLILTPHVGGLTREANIRVSEATVRNVLAALAANQRPNG